MICDDDEEFPVSVPIADDLRRLQQENAALLKQSSEWEGEALERFVRIEELESENARLAAEVAEWKHRAIGGTCRILSDENCDCSLCKRDREIERLIGEGEELRHSVASIESALRNVSHERDVFRERLAESEAIVAKLPTTAEIDAAKRGSERTMVVQPASEDDMNKTERLYSEELELMRLAGSIRQWKFGSLKLRLADRTWYHPDFVVVMPSGWICLDEIKGFEREDAVVKFKVAAEMYPYFRFRMIKRIDGQWVVTRDLNQGAGV